MIGSRTFLLTLILSLTLLHPAAARPRSAPQPPRLYAAKVTAPEAGFVRRVPAGGDLQAALNAANPGEVVELEAGATFTGNFVLPEKPAGTSWIIIRSSRAAELPTGERVTPLDAPLMAKVVSPNASPALRTAARAHHYQIVGIEFTIADSVRLNYGIVTFGQGVETSADLLPADLILERCYIHGTATADVSRGVALNSRQAAVLDSHISDCHAIGFDSQAIGGWNGPGPFKIVNNYLEGAGENIMFGGSDPKIENLVPSDIEIRRNHCFKPPAWREGIVARPSGLGVMTQFVSGSLLAGGTTYYYRVAARGRAGYNTMATSAASEEIAVSLPFGHNAVRLTWTGAERATEFRVYRTADPPSAPARVWAFYTVNTNNPLGAQTLDDFNDASQLTEGPPPGGATRWTVKNLFELKNARRVLVDGNIFENNWTHGQNGVAILFTVRNQGGKAPWSVVEDVTFTNNIVRHTAAGINILGRDNLQPSQQTRRILIKNNLFEDVDGSRWSGNGVFLTITESSGVTVDQNTVMQSGNIITAYGRANEDFVFNNNLVPHNRFGIIGDGTAPGEPTMEKFFPTRVFKRNVVIGAPTAYPALKNYYPGSMEEVQFMDHAHGDYRLAPWSPYKNRGTKRQDIGANIDIIIRQTAGVVKIF